MSECEIKNLPETIEKTADITKEQLAFLLATEDDAMIQDLKQRARNTGDRIYGKNVYIRGLIEFTNYCKNDCLYCGIRRSNCHADRYRLTEEEILSCCKNGYELGFRTFVLQGGEDGFYTDEKICQIVSKIKAEYPDCAVTLSIGEKSRESYQAYFDAGADRYLLRHETADEAHYKKLHPAEMSYQNRMRCLRDLKEIGYQTGCGFMVGSPYQTVDTLWEDLQFIRRLKPQMVGIGPFIPQKDTPFGTETAGTMEMTLRLLSIIRLIHPHVLLPATTALGTIHPKGRELGILAGANVVMPNLSPVAVREKYKLYDNKICTGDEAAECRFCMQKRMESIGYQVAVNRGDFQRRVVVFEFPRHIVLMSFVADNLTPFFGIVIALRHDHCNLFRPRWA
jgi:biotin synthase